MPKPHPTNRERRAATEGRIRAELALEQMLKAVPLEHLPPSQIHDIEVVTKKLRELFHSLRKLEEKVWRVPRRTKG